MKDIRSYFGHSEGASEKALGHVKHVLEESPILAFALLLCAIVGFISFFSSIWSFVKLLLSLYVIPGNSLKRYGAGQGKWAVITGASDGLGKEYALQLAKAGFNVALISRTQSKLDALAKEIEENFGVSTLVIPVDYTKADDTAFVKLADTLGPLPVTILVNNVGQSHEIPTPFVLTSNKEINDIVTVNCMGTLKTTKALLPSIIDRQARSTTKTKALILTMGSFAGNVPPPLLATYSGSKAFLASWNVALANEVKQYGIDAWLVNSYLVASAMSKIRKTSLMIPNPKQFVRATLGSIGVQRGSLVPNVTVPYPTHAIFAWFISLLDGMQHLVVEVNGYMHLDIRQRALAKLNKKSKSN